MPRAQYNDYTVTVRLFTGAIVDRIYRGRSAIDAAIKAANKADVDKAIRSVPANIQPA